MPSLGDSPPGKIFWHSGRSPTCLINSRSIVPVDTRLSFSNGGGSNGLMNHLLIGATYTTLIVIHLPSSLQYFFHRLDGCSVIPTLNILQLPESTVAVMYDKMEFTQHCQSERSKRSSTCRSNQSCSLRTYHQHPPKKDPNQLSVLQ